MCMSHSDTDTKTIYGYWWWNKKYFGAQAEYWVYFKFEKISVNWGSLRQKRSVFLAEECALQERLNKYVAFNFKGTQVHASTASDWLIKALFAVSGIPIALSQVIEKKKKKSLFPGHTYKKAHTTKSSMWLKRTPVTIVFLFNTDINIAYASMLIMLLNYFNIFTVHQCGT